MMCRSFEPVYSPEACVMMTVCETLGSVNSFFTAAAEAQNEDTPGMTW